MSTQKKLNQQHEIKRSRPDSGTSDEESVFTSDFPRCLLIQAKDDSEALAKLSPFVVGKALKCQVGTLDSVKRLRRGDLLVETSKETYSDALLKTTILANIPVKVTPHRTLNSSKGVIRSRDIARCDTDEIIDNLHDQGVVDAFIISVKDGVNRRPTNTVILTFNKPKPPQHITAGYLRVLVAVYVPNPLRCFNCQRFGHGKQHCKGQQTCVRCGDMGHADIDCNKAEHCVNCSGDHAASSKTCPKWQLEQKVQQVKAEKNISFIEARKMVTAQMKSQQPSMASVVSSAAPRSVPPVSTKDAEVQTDYTWPETAQQPTKIVKLKSVTSKSTATDAGKSVIAGESASSKGDKGKSSHPRITRPPSQPFDPATDPNRFAVLGSLSTEEGSSSAPVK